MDISKIVKKFVEGEGVISTKCPSHGYETTFTYIGSCDWGTESIPGMKEYPLENRAQYNCHCPSELTGTTLSLSSLMDADPTIINDMKKQNMWVDYTKAKENVLDVDGNAGNFTWTYLLALNYMQNYGRHSIDLPGANIETFMENLADRIDRDGKIDTIKDMSQVTNYCESGLRTGWLV